MATDKIRAPNIQEYMSGHWSGTPEQFSSFRGSVGTGPQIGPWGFGGGAQYYRDAATPAAPAAETSASLMGPKPRPGVAAAPPRTTANLMDFYGMFQSPWMQTPINLFQTQNLMSRNPMLASRLFGRGLGY